MMRDITKLDINLIDDFGRYIDKKHGKRFTLSDKEIIEIRRYHHNRLIAKNRVRVNDKGYKVKVYNENKLRKRVKLRRHNNHRKITKRWLKRNAKALILRGVLGVSIAGGIIGGAKGVSEVIHILGQKPYSGYTREYEEKEEIASYQSVINEEEETRKEIIKKYCDIFQVDYNIVYKTLSSLTDNFTSDDYYEGIIPRIKCKGVQVKAESDEELFLCAIRHIKQCPKDFGLKEEELYIENGYKSSEDYLELIEKYSNLFHIDPCLVAAIVRQETGFDSNLLNNAHNPAGLMINGEFWKFDNIDQGMIELCAEISWHYYPQIGCSKDEVNEKIIKKIGEIHAPKAAADINKYWIPNVISFWVEYKNEDVFSNLGKAGMSI